MHVSNKIWLCAYGKKKTSKLRNYIWNLLLQIHGTIFFSGIDFNDQVVC